MTQPAVAPSGRRWRVAAATVVGTSHVAAGRGGDDAFAFWVDPIGTSVVVAVADGAGSRSGTSALGAFEACAAVMASAPHLASAVAATDVAGARAAARSTFDAARAAVLARAARLGRPAGDLATTLALAVLTPAASLVAQVGDGVVVCDVDGQQRALVKAVKGEYANETDFLTSARPLEESLLVEHLPTGLGRFALSTDGLRYKILRIQDGGEPFEPFFTAAWDHVASGRLDSGAARDLLVSMADDQADDDLTLVIGALVPTSDPATVGWPAPGASSAQPAEPGSRFTVEPTADADVAKTAQGDPEVPDAHVVEGIGEGASDSLAGEPQEPDPVVWLPNPGADEGVPLPVAWPPLPEQDTR